jgi:membrane associated rhomboid family serine protease
MYYFYWLPIGTDAKVRGIPWATVSLCVAMVVSFAALHVVPGGETLAYRLAFKAGQPTPGTAIASLFLHADPFHLLGNLIFLAVFGAPLESRLGAARYLIAFLGCGWMACLVQAAWILRATPELASIPIIGASGAISGLMGLYLVRLYFARLRFASITMLFFQGMVKPARFTLPAVVGIGLWFALQFAYQISGAAPETATLAHLGGFVFGGIFGWSMGLMGEGHLESRLARGARYASRGEWFASLGEYESYLEKRPQDAEVVAQVARLSRVTHQEDQAADRFRDAIHLWLRQGEIRSACDAYEEMKRLLGGVTLPPADLLRVARGCEELGRPGDASRAYEAYGRNYPDRGGAALALMKSAEIEHRSLNNPGRARYLYDELLRRPLKPDLEKLVQERAQRADAALARQGAAAV